MQSDDLYFFKQFFCIYNLELGGEADWWGLAFGTRYFLNLTLTIVKAFFLLRGIIQFL